MNKKFLTEADIRSKFITPAIVGEGGAGWDLMTQVLEEHYFTRGRVIVRGRIGAWDFSKPSTPDSRPAA